MTLMAATAVVDAVYSILRDVSRMPAVNAAQQRLSALGIRTLGGRSLFMTGSATR